MSTTLIDLKNAFESASKAGNAEAETFVNTLEDYLQGSKVLATKTEVEQVRGDVKLVQWMVGYLVVVITVEILTRWFF